MKRFCPFIVALLGLHIYPSSVRASVSEEFKKKTGINLAKPVPSISVHDINSEIQKKTGINPGKPYPKVSVNEINNEIKKKFGVDPQIPFGTAGDNWLFKSWKPFREPLLPTERAANEAMAVVEEGKKWAVLFLETMFWNRHWPEGFPKQIVKRLSNPSVEINIQKTTLNATTALYKGEVIPLGHGDFVEVGSISLRLDAARNVYAVDISGGKLVYKFIRENSFHIKSATFEAIPVIGSENNTVVLELCIRCVYLDVEHCPGEIDRFIAHAINEALEATHGNVIGKFDLGHSLAQPIDMRTESKAVAIPTIKEATAFINGEAITAQLSFDLAKEPKAGPQMRRIEVR